MCVYALMSVRERLGKTESKIPLQEETKKTILVSSIKWLDWQRCKYT